MPILLHWLLNLLHEIRGLSDLQEIHSDHGLQSELYLQQ